MQELNHAQKEAVSHFEGPMLVLAGPCSGKTRVITERIHFLIQEKKVPPERILVITFTRAAAGERKERYQTLYSKDFKSREAGKISGKIPGSAGVRFGTFHSVFFMILKYAYHYTAENIIKEELRRELLRRILQQSGLELQDENEFVDDLEKEIGKVKGERIDLQNYYSPFCAAEIFRDMFGKYQRELEKRRLLDFDDILVYCCELLRERPDILAMWQRQFPYILVDEFQDISLIQYDIVKMLAAPKNNLFIVGDDDQSIYGFRGARPDIMKQFLADFRDAGQCLLNVNYRCSSPIAEEAAKVISQNKNRLQKEIVSFDHEKGRWSIEISEEGLRKRILDGTEEIFTIERYGKISEENDAIRKKIEGYHKQGICYREMAVLFRTNMQARSLSANFLEYNVPFLMKESVPNLYHHWIVQDVLTYIRVALGNREREQVMRIINKPKRYVHRNAFIEPYADFEGLKLFYEEKEWMQDRIEKLQYDLSMLTKMRPFAAVNCIRRGIGYNDFIQEYAEYRGIPAEDLFDILEELSEEAKGFESYEEWFAHIQSYEEELREQKKKRAGKEKEEDAVMFMTMHGAKGLEYECVFIPDANEGVTPHNKSVLEADMEEERRMFYVAMTRAKKHLHISYLEERYNKAADASRFLEEMF
ncbi:MAG: ATP-dependent helicase [Lachnospiraceae bacterium]|nr:ATP-dependent helicase [Lachnospiraceae bacterium]